MTDVQLRDGVTITCADGLRVVADASDPTAALARGDDDAPPGVAAVTHAHGDHLFDTPPEGVVCSDATADLARVRRDGPIERTSHDRVSLRPSGHVAGSRAVVVTDTDGTRVCYTGDVSTRDRWYLSGFEPPDVDVLVIEATYGEPEYRFPPHDEVAGEIRDWLADTDAPVLLFGYALGRAQKLQLLAREAGRNVLVSEAIAELSAAIESHVGREFPGGRYEDLDAIESDDAVVLPAGLSGADWVERLADRTGAVTAGFSGWAIDDSFKYRGGYDATFPLSDHCDFPELIELVETADPDRIYTQHGSAETLARELTNRGWHATALAEGQHTLGDFG